ncbi:hypothetical protein ITP53_20975 [Nonomuraea sp. K274]|uniref:Heparinase II/III-like protein n=1 Tax=Nonomuraea cypriaca TaxID=1187855 RepID=A0A931AAA9_9ACTN|nr:hypothetical protein [Nonomuraea cypriaca]MBF8188158.1 hypothetical protein [Nonomuraea cypriaca]
MFAERVDKLRPTLTTTHAPQWRRLHEQCDWYRLQHPPAEHPTASITYFGPAAANLALAYRLTGREGYLREAWRWISTCIAYPHWGKAKLPDHDLDAGWLLHGLSLAYGWLGDFPGRGELRAKLELQGQRLYDYAVETEGTWWSSSYWQNHNWICYAGLATAGYALERPEWTERARKNFETVFELLAPDGSDAEGVVYWRYGVPWLAIYADLLERSEGVSLWDHGTFLRNTFNWRLHQCAPGLEENVDHGDCHDRRSGHSVALYHKLASVYRIGEAQWLAERVRDRFLWREAYASGVKPGIMPEAFLELLWYDPSVTPVEPAGDTAAYFPDLGQVTVRTGWDDDATFVSFKAAPGGGHHAWETAQRFRAERGWETLNAGHHHPDAGSFTLASHGAFLAVDDGYCNAKRAAHHNLVLVDGQGWAGEGRYHVYKDLPDDRVPQMRDVLAADGFAHATSSTAVMFDPALAVRRCDRTLAMTPSGRVVALDLLAADVPREWTLLLHSDWPAERHGDDITALVSGPGHLWVRRLAPAEAVVTETTTDVEANPTASTPSLSMAKTQHTLRTTSPRVTRTAFLLALEPAPALAPGKPVAMGRATAANQAVVVFPATGGLPEETVLLAPDGGRVSGGGVEADAAAVIVSGDRVALVAATRVVRDGKVIHESAEPWTGVPA